MAFASPFIFDVAIGLRFSRTVVWLKVSPELVGGVIGDLLLKGDLGGLDHSELLLLRLEALDQGRLGSRVGE